MITSKDLDVSLIIYVQFISWKLPMKWSISMAYILIYVPENICMQWRMHLCVKFRKVEFCLLWCTHTRHAQKCSNKSGWPKNYATRFFFGEINIFIEFFTESQLIQKSKHRAMYTRYASASHYVHAIYGQMTSEVSDSEKKVENDKNFN